MKMIELLDFILRILLVTLSICLIVYLIKYNNGKNIKLLLKRQYELEELLDDIDYDNTDEEVEEYIKLCDKIKSIVMGDE
jgi:hypothetical protein